MFVSALLLGGGFFLLNSRPRSEPPEQNAFRALEPRAPRPAAPIQQNLDGTNTRPLPRPKIDPLPGSSFLDGKKSADAALHRVWDTNFLVRLQTMRTNDPIQFALADERVIARGRITRLERKGGEVIHVAGFLTEPESGRFFFQKQSGPGRSGDFVGIAEFPASGKACRIESGGPGGAPLWVERPLGFVLCFNLPRAPRTPDNSSSPIRKLAANDAERAGIPDHQNGILSLQSRTGATPVLYLDFQGGYTPAWGGVTYERPNLDDSQIREIWQRVAEDFKPFELNVTTDLECFRRAPEATRQRVIITPTDTASPGLGGAAYMDSFNWFGETPCWVFETLIPKSCAEACSHEAGHTMGLSHDGQNINGAHAEYYYGHGDGELSWAPIMGVPYRANVTQWCKGEYVNANNTQDQLAILASQNGMRFREDDAGDTFAEARFLEIYSEGRAGASGIIGFPRDTDAFQFLTRGGAVALRAAPLNPGANLAISLTLLDFNGAIAPGNLLSLDLNARPGESFDLNGTRIISNGSPPDLSATLTGTLSAGSYLLRVTGAGRNNPLTNGFSPYGSLGSYVITGTVENARGPTRFTIGENTPSGAILGAVEPAVPGHGPLVYAITGGNIGGAFAAGTGGILTVATSGPLDYEALSGNGARAAHFKLSVDIIDEHNPALSETNVPVLVVVTNVNEPPVITGFVAPAPLFADIKSTPVPGTTNEPMGAVIPCSSSDCQFSVAVLEHSPTGTFAGQVIASDPDFLTRLSYSILPGKVEGKLAIDPRTGVIVVAGDLAAGVRSKYDFTVVVSDETEPRPLTVFAGVSINVDLPFRRGTISCATYAPLSGTSLSALTNDFLFPSDPVSETQLSALEAGLSPPENHGAVIRGYLLPPITGTYTLWISAGDSGELWLGSSTNFSTLERVAYNNGEPAPGPREWSANPSQQSEPITLEAGHAYSIEARMAAGARPGHLAVAWECAAAGITRDVIPGQYLAPYFMNYAPHPLGFSANVRLDALGGSYIGTVLVADLNSNDVSSVTITSGNESGIFGLSAKTGVLRLFEGKSLSVSSRTNFVLKVEARDSGNPTLVGATTVYINVVQTGAILTGSIYQEIWTNASPGVLLASLVGDARFPKRPDLLRPLSGTDSSPGTLPANSGSRIRAYLTPTNTGAHAFFIASDGESRLKFSLDGNPASASIIAWADTPGDYREWTRSPSQTSGDVWLEGGRRYYLEALHKQTAVAGHVEVAWTGPGLDKPTLIDASFLSPIDLEYAPDLLSTNVTLSFTAGNGTLVTTLAATDSPADRLTYRIVSGNTGNTFGIDPESGRITLATNTLLAVYAITNVNLLVEAQDSGYGGIYPLKSTRATVSVRLIDDAPPVRWAGLGLDANWSSGANWVPAAPREGARISFFGAPQRTNYNDVLTRAGLIQVNPGGYRFEGKPLVLRGGLSFTGNNDWAIPSTLEGNQTFENSSGVLTVSRALQNNGYGLTWRVNQTAILNNVLSGRGGMIKYGRGKLIISAPALYTGETSIDEGTLILTNSGSIGASTNIKIRATTLLDASALRGSFVVPAGQTLRGSGAVNGPVTVQGVLIPDVPSSTASLRFTNGLTLAGNVICQVSGAPTPAIQVSGELIYGGTLTLTNLPSQLKFGSTFLLFRADRIAGVFAAANMPKLDRGLSWDLSPLSTDGTVRVALAQPRLTLVNNPGPSPSIRFDMANGVDYLIESASILDSPVVWEPIATRAGHGTIINVPLPYNPTEPQRYFRVRPRNR